MAETKQKKKAGSGERGKDELVFVALGGLGEIGMNVYLYGWGPEEDRSWLMVDLGVTFPGDTEPGVDVVLPDLSFITKEHRNLVGITHRGVSIGRLAVEPQLRAGEHLIESRAQLSGRGIEHIAD